MRVPQEVLKQRVQADIYPNAAVGFVKMVQDNGVGAFYKGYVATVSRDVPWNALSFMFFAQAKSIFKKVTGDAPTTDQNLALGALSGMTAAVIMTPIDVVKTRLMTQAAVVGAVPYTGVVDCVSTMLRTEGPGIFLAGIRPRMAYMGPLWALQFGLNGAATDAIKKRKAAKAAAEKRK